MTVSKIYFDMDGVLADFDRGVVELCKMAPVDQAKKTKAQDDELFGKMRSVEHFYGELKPLPEALEMFFYIYEQLGDRCEILSGIPKDYRGIVNAKTDKMDWVKRYLGEHIVSNIVYRAEKVKYCTGPECILIDDFCHTIHEWKSLGGTGILHTSPAKTLEELRNLAVIR
ncbi:MAG: hypothetical protein K6C69_00515 [Lachnospiraceae bacterium]|nr:hypothetical protein [Lachnospiraceae bacterium]